MSECVSVHLNTLITCNKSASCVQLTAQTCVQDMDDLPPATTTLVLPAAPNDSALTTTTLVLPAAPNDSAAPHDNLTVDMAEHNQVCTCTSVKGFSNHITV